jgi:hypothetical protein
MSWPYHLLDLTHEQKHERRLLLDRYGVYAQLSALIPILGYQFYRLSVWMYSERQRSKTKYSAIPSSPTLKRTRTSASGTWAARTRALVWWLESEVAIGWGLRGQWIAAGFWVSWLLFLCVHQTGQGTCSSALFPFFPCLLPSTKCQISFFFENFCVVRALVLYAVSSKALVIFTISIYLEPTSKRLMGVLFLLVLLV